MAEEVPALRSDTELALRDLNICHILLDQQNVPRLVECTDGKPGALYNRLATYISACLAVITRLQNDKIDAQKQTETGKE